MIDTQSSTLINCLCTRSSLAADLYKNLNHQEIREKVQIFHDFSESFRRIMLRLVRSAEEALTNNRVNTNLLSFQEMQEIKRTVNKQLNKVGAERATIMDVVHAPAQAFFHLNSHGEVNLTLLLKIVMKSKRMRLLRVQAGPFQHNDALYDITFDKPLIAIDSVQFEHHDNTTHAEYLPLDSHDLDQCSKIGRDYVCSNNLFLVDPSASCIATTALNPSQMLSVCPFRRSNATFILSHSSYRKPVETLHVTGNDNQPRLPRRSQSTTSSERKLPPRHINRLFLHGRRIQAVSNTPSP